jgi:hypothetical protein
VAATPSWRVILLALPWFVDWSLGSLSPGNKSAGSLGRGSGRECLGPVPDDQDQLRAAVHDGQPGRVASLLPTGWMRDVRFTAASVPTQGDPDIYLCCRNGAWSAWSTFAGLATDSVTVTTTRGDLYTVGVHGWTTARYGLVTSGADSPEPESRPETSRGACHPTCAAQRRIAAADASRPAHRLSTLPACGYAVNRALTYSRLYRQ